MAEIKVNLLELRKAICTMKSLEKGTGYRLYSTSELINHGRGQFFEQTNVMYRELMQIEEAMKQIISNTIKALTYAGINFEEFDHDLSDLIRSVGVTVEKQSIK